MKMMRQCEWWAADIIEFRESSAGARSWAWMLYLLWRREKGRVNSERDRIHISDSGVCIRWHEEMAHENGEIA